ASHILTNQRRTDLSSQVRKANMNPRCRVTTASTRRPGYACAIFRPKLATRAEYVRAEIVAPFGPLAWAALLPFTRLVPRRSRFLLGSLRSPQTLLPSESRGPTQEPRRLSGPASRDAPTDQLASCSTSVSACARCGAQSDAVCPPDASSSAPE